MSATKMTPRPTAFVRPQVNLLPPEVTQGRRLRQTKMLLLVVVLAVVLATMVTYVASAASALSAKSDLTKAQDQSSSLMAQQSKYADVPLVLGQVATAEQARQLGMSTEILWAPYVDAIRAVAPAGTSISTLAVVGATPMAAAPVPPNPLALPAVATITVTFRSLTVPVVADWLDAMRAVPGFADPWFSAATVGEENGVVYYDVSATVDVDQAAFASRFVPKKGS
jgi:hypothetical protein